MSTITTEAQTTIDLTNRRHPDYTTQEAHWRFLKSTYEGGREWFDTNVFKYYKEGEQEYKERVERAYRFNHTREVVDLVNKYIFKADIARKEDAERYVKDFWSNTTLQKRDMNHFIEMASKLSSIYGRVWIVVDSTASSDNLSVAAAKAQKARTYAYTVSPLDVLDLAYGEDGELNWIMIREFYRDDENPFDYSGLIREQVRLWTRDGWYLYRQTDNKSPKVNFTYHDSGTHNLGIVPVTYLDHNESENPYVSTSLIADIAYLDRAVANYLSNLDAIIQDQTFSQLVIPAEALAFMDAESEDGQRSLGEKLLEFGTKRVFLYTGEGTSAPEYISPDPKQAGVILSVINKIIGEIYHSVGMAGERTKQDNAAGIDNSSGVAKAYDFERMNAMLANKAKSLEFCENRIIRIVKAWHNELINPDDVEDYVTYSRDFDVRNLSNEFDIANNLATIMGPKVLRQEQMKQLVDKLWPQMSKKLKEKIKADIEKDWLSEDFMVATGQVNAPKPAGEVAPKSSVPKKNGSQGENNKPAK